MTDTVTDKPPSSRGGARAGSGRPKGSPNKATRPLKALAQKHGPEAIKTLLELMREGETHSVRVAAARELLDRGYGNPATVVAGDGDGGPVGLSLAVHFMSPEPRPEPVEAHIADIPQEAAPLLLEGTVEASDREPLEDRRPDRTCRIALVG